MQAPSGKAEIWIYEEKRHISSNRIQIGDKPITEQVQGADGVYRTVRVANEPIFRTEHIYDVSETQVLIYNDLYINLKTSTQRVKTME